MNSETELVLVTPIYNEEANIKNVIEEWHCELTRLGIRYQWLAINDASKDNTAQILEGLKASYPGLVPLNKPNSGHGLTCRFGYDLAVKQNAPWVLQIDSDGQCQPRFFESFWAKREQADCIFGFRASRDDGWTRVWISKICRLLTSLLSGKDLGDPNVPYRLIRGPFLAKALASIPADFDMQNIALTLSLKRNSKARWAYVPIHFPDRQGGTNSINLKRIMRMGWVLLTNLHRIGR